MTEHRREDVTPPPRCFREGLSEVEAKLVQGFWRRLSPRDRRRLAVLYDARAESCSYSAERRRDGSCAWYGVPVEVMGRFTDGPEPDEAPIDFYEYLVNHELTLDDGPRFHICTRHAAAEAVIRRGFVPAGFTCPLRLAECPMRRALDLGAGRSLVLGVRVAHRRASPSGASSAPRTAFASPSASSSA
jgi:hypothetical protein